MKYSNMLYLAIASMAIVTTATTYSMETVKSSSSSYDTSAGSTADDNPLMTAPVVKPSTRRQKNSLIESDEVIKQQKAVKDTSNANDYIYSDDIKAFNKQRNKTKSSCFGCFGKK